MRSVHCTSPHGHLQSSRRQHRSQRQRRRARPSTIHVAMSWLLLREVIHKELPLDTQLLTKACRNSPPCGQSLGGQVMIG